MPANAAHSRWMKVSLLLLFGASFLGWADTRGEEILAPRPGTPLRESILNDLRATEPAVSTQTLPATANAQASFSPGPFHLQLAVPSASAESSLPRGSFYGPLLAIGPVVFHFQVPSRFSKGMDAPGPGYRKLRTKPAENRQRQAGTI